jgi:hypothetical protein
MAACKKHIEIPEWGYSECVGCEIERLRSDIAQLKQERDSAIEKFIKMRNELASLKYPGLTGKIKAMTPNAELTGGAKRSPC